MKLSVRLEGGVILMAGFQVRGCTASIAAGSALADWLTGREVKSITREAAAAAVEDSLGGVPEASRHVLALCADAAAAIAALSPR